jgi:hypothetical protein
MLGLQWMDTARAYIDEINTPIYEQQSSPRTVNEVKSLSCGLPSSLTAMNALEGGSWCAL